MRGESLGICGMLMREGPGAGSGSEPIDRGLDSPCEDRRGEHGFLEPMRAQDLAEVAELEKICFGDPWSRASFQAELDASPVSWCRVLRLDGKIAGYMVVWFVEEEAHLANIAVAPQTRRQGHAQRMLGALYKEAYLRGSRMIVLEVRASNQAAINLYQRNGFIEGGIRRNYYNHPQEDAIVMVRRLWMQEWSA